MKKLKAFSLLEFIFTISILSIILIISTTYIKNFYSLYSFKSDTLIKELELDNINLFIKNRLQTAKNIQLINNSITFYDVDRDNFLNSNYYGILDLNKSTKEILFAPKSSFNSCNDKYIYFDNNQLLKIKSFENEKIVLDDYPQALTIYENFYLINSISKIFLDNSKLYFDDKLIGEDIGIFNILDFPSYIQIQLCKENNICKTYRYEKL